MSSFYISKLIRSAVFVGLAIAVWKVVPVYASALRFHLSLSEACRTAATGQHGPDAVRQDILFRARQFNLPVRPHQVDVRVQPRLVSAVVAYQVPVELGPRQWVLKFHAAAQERPLVTYEGGEEYFERLRE